MNSRIATLTLIVLSVGAVLFGVLVAGPIVDNCFIEANYQRNRSPEAKALHQRLAEELKISTRGDFVIHWHDTDQRIGVVSNDPNLQGGTTINMEEFGVSGFSSDSPESLARDCSRIVRKTDTYWPEVAKKFFEQ